MRKIIKQWLDAIFYPVPEFYGETYYWEEFVQRASYKRVRRLLNRNCYRWSVSWQGCRIIEILMCRVLKKGWPKLSKRLCKKYEQRIFRVESLATAKSEVRSKFKNGLPKILVDKNNQCLGIVVTNDLILCGFIELSLNHQVAQRMSRHAMIDTTDIYKMQKKGEYLNDLYEILFNRDLYNKYWAKLTGGGLIDEVIWNFPHETYSSMHYGDRRAMFMFKM